jgi:hypothetical protein
MSVTSMRCALCNEYVDQAMDSAEHLFLNAISGRRNLRGILWIETRRPNSNGNLPVRGTGCRDIHEAAAFGPP